MMLAKAFGHLIDCKKAAHLVSRMQDAPLSSVDRVLLRMHVACCAACARFDEQMAFLRKAMHRYRE
jgi:hypothetical protein